MTPLMRPWIPSTPIGVLLAAALLLGLCTRHTAADPQEGRRNVDPPKPVFAVRFSEQLLRSSNPDRVERKPVDTCVLGVRQRGTATVVSKLSAELITPRGENPDIVILLVAQGTSRVVTQGHQGPATIHAVTQSQFIVRTPIRFDTSSGFSAGEPDAEVAITDECREIRTHLPGLRGRLVRHVGRNRLQSQQAKLRQIVRRNTEQRIHQSVEQRVDQRVAVWNRHWERLHAALKDQTWYADLSDIELTTEPNHVLVYFVRPANSNSEPASTELAQPPLPAPHDTALLEVLVKDSWVREEPLAAEIIALFSSAASPILVFSVEDETLHVQTDQSVGWHRFLLHNAETLPAPRQKDPGPREPSPSRNETPSTATLGEP